jgi:hypothetical protein
MPSHHVGIKPLVYQWFLGLTGNKPSASKGENDTKLSGASSLMSDGP